MAKDTHNALKTSLAVGGFAALAITGYQLLAQKGCEEFLKRAAVAIVAAQVANKVSQQAVALAQQFGLSEDAIRIGADAIEVVSLIAAARAQRKAKGSCFIAGTKVLVGDPKNLGLFSEKNIEDIQAGDWVWSRDENAPDDPLLLRQVTQTFNRTAHDLQVVSVRSASGETETINATDEHPFFVQGAGWSGAESLRVGDRLTGADGGELIVVSNSDDKHANRRPSLQLRSRGQPHVLR
jgi:hypothetical protein